MSRDEIEKFRRILQAFAASAAGHGAAAAPDRAQVVAHATLSAWAHHWPSQVDPGTRALLEATQAIRTAEPGRWMVQRRIAIAKLAAQPIPPS
jgi:hypothetical protein